MVNIEDDSSELDPTNPGATETVTADDQFIKKRNLTKGQKDSPAHSKRPCYNPSQETKSAPTTQSINRPPLTSKQAADINAAARSMLEETAKIRSTATDVVSCGKQMTVCM